MRTTPSLKLTKKHNKQQKNKHSALHAFRLNDVLNHPRNTSFPHLVYSITFCKLSKDMCYHVVLPVQVTNFPATKRLKEIKDALIQMT